MDNKQLTLNLLGLAMRARKTVLGTEFVLKGLMEHPGSVLFLATDAGENVQKKIQDKLKLSKFTIISDFTAEELSAAIGKENRRVILVTDKGFCKKFIQYMNS